jgi:hypothetical protein
MLVRMLFPSPEQATEYMLISRCKLNNTSSVKKGSKTEIPNLNRKRQNLLTYGIYLALATYLFYL